MKRWLCKLNSGRISHSANSYKSHT